MSKCKGLLFITFLLAFPLFLGDGVRMTAPAQEKDSKSSPRLDESGDPLPSGAVVRFGTLRFRWSFLSARLSPDGKKYAIGNWGRTSVMDITTGKVLFHLEGEGMCRPLAFSPDGKTLAMNDKLGLHLYDLDKRQKLQSLAGSYDRVLFSPDGKKFALDIRDTIRLREVNGNKELWKREKSPTETSAYLQQFTPDGKNLIVQCYLKEAGCVIRFLDVATGKERPGKTIPIAGNTEIRVSTDGKTLVRASWDDGDVDLEDLHAGKTLLRFGGFKIFDRLAFSPNSKLLAWGSRKGIMVMDVARGRELYRIEGIKGTQATTPFGLLTFLPDSKTLAFSVNNEMVIQFWNIQSKKLLHPETPGHRNFVMQLAFSPDSRRLFSGSWDGTVRLWDLAKKNEVDRLETKFYLESSLTSGGKICVPEEFQGKNFVIWDFFTRKSFPIRQGKGDGFLRGKLSPDGHFLAMKTFDGISVQDLRQKKEVKLLKSHAWPRSFSPDGQYLVASEDKELEVWKINSREEKPLTLPEKSFDVFSFSADGKFLVGASHALKSGQVVLWEFPSLKQRLAWKGIKDSLAASPDGATLAMGTAEGKVILWDVHKDRKIRESDGHLGSVTSLAFSPDGRFLASGGLDTTILLWDVGELPRLKQ